MQRCTIENQYHRAAYRKWDSHLSSKRTTESCSVAPQSAMQIHKQNAKTLHRRKTTPLTNAHIHCFFLDYAWKSKKNSKIKLNTK